MTAGDIASMAAHYQGSIMYYQYKQKLLGRRYSLDLGAGSTNHAADVTVSAKKKVADIV